MYFQSLESLSGTQISRAKRPLEYSQVMSHTRNRERLSHLPKITQYRVLVARSHSPALKAEDLDLLVAHDRWAASFYPGAVKAEVLGYLDPGLRDLGETVTKGMVVGKPWKSREPRGPSEYVEMARCLLRFIQGHTDMGTRSKEWLLGPPSVLLNRESFWQ